jgi:hypothetical protein
MPVNLEEARRIALSAVSGARGYVNYLLGCIALREKQTAEEVKFLVESIKAGFMPAATHLASITESISRDSSDFLRGLSAWPCSYPRSSELGRQFDIKYFRYIAFR